jgi:hypothetical protein
MGIINWRRPANQMKAVVFAILFLATVGACRRGASGPSTVPVTGTVTFNGSPVDGAMVTFLPAGTDDPRVGSQAETDHDGRYQLRTHIGAGKFKDGVVPGAYLVTVNKLDTAAIKTTYAPPKNLLPKKYADGKTSQLKAEVAVGKENDFAFALKGE